MSGRTVSARLNARTIWELEFLQSLMGDKKTTEILTEAIHHLYESQSQNQHKKTPYDFLKETGFIGAVKGSKHDSTDYKKHIGKRTSKKL